MVNNEGNAEIMGVVLLIAIFVAAVGLMGITMLSSPQPEKVPAVALDFWADDSHTNISLIHRGGETLNLSGAKVMVVYSGDSTAQDETSKFMLTNTSGLSSHISATSPYSIGDNLSFTADRAVDQVQLIWPGTGVASMTGGGGAVLLGAWFPNSSSGRNPPAAVTGAVPITFPYPSEGPTWTQPTQTPAVPWVYFIANITATNGTLPINFTDLTDYHGSTSYKRSWNFGNGPNVADQTNPYTYSHYQAPTEWPYIQNYTVTLNLTNESGTFTPYSLARPNYISVYKSPMAGFEASPLEGNSGMEVWFINRTTGYETSLSWDFGDGNQTTNAYPRPVFPYTYYNPGSIQQNYNASLIANVALRDNPPESSDPPFQRTIIVHPQVIAAFNATPMTGSAPLTVSFDSSSQGYLIGYFWDFGDGNNSTSQNPQHTYAAAGNYTVNLTVSNTLPGPNTSTTSRTITVTAPPLTPPVADFTAIPMNGTAPLNVTFNDKSTNAPTTWNWSFGDGTYSTNQTEQHTYNTPGNYTVTLTASNTAGNSTASKTITVYNNQDTIRVNCGGGDYPDKLGNLWLADQAYNITSGWGYSPAEAPVYSMNGSIANTSDPTLYQTSRWSNTGTVDYLFNVPNGDYTVQLKFAETDTTVTNYTQRTFDVTINGKTEPGNFNIYTTAGLNSATDLYSNVNVTENLIHITLKSTTGQPMIAAIGIAPASTQITPDFNGSPQIGNAPLTVNFTDKTTGPGIINGWFWDFGDGTTNLTEQHAQNPQHTYATAGTYNVTLTAGNANQSRTVVKTNYITVYETPVAAFTPTEIEGNSGMSVLFNASNSTGYITNLAWNFGDGTTATGQNPTHTFYNNNTTPVTYTVTLNASSPWGSSTTTHTVIVHRPLVANFTFDPVTGNSPLIDQLNSTSTGDGTLTYLWDFGNGWQNAPAKPLHTFVNPPGTDITYQVKMKVSNDWGTAEITKPITVYQQLVPSFTATPTIGNSPLTVQFDASTSKGSNLVYTWTFGDGTSGTGLTPTHRYYNNGTTPVSYNVSLTISNTYGNAITPNTIITVYPPLQAIFNATPSEGNAPVNVSFVDNSLGEAGNVSRVWTFGDGTTGSGQTPTHIYNSQGTYIVNLTIDNGFGTSSTTTRTIIVHPSLNASFTATPPSGNLPLPVQFNDTSTGYNITSWSWNFGDGTTSTVRNATHTFQTTGTFTVTLSVSNQWETKTTTRTVTVISPLRAGFSAATSGGGGLDAPRAVQFTDTSIGSPTSWSWNFGDGTAVVTTQNPIHTYTSAGTYTVTLTISNQYGSDSTSETVSVITSKNHTISGIVYNDLNKQNTLPDPNEPGLAGWTVGLYEDNYGTLTRVDTTTTGADGSYMFPGLDKNKFYDVFVDLPAGWQYTTPDTGSYRQRMSGNQDFPDVDFGVFQAPLSGNINLRAQKPGSLVSGGYFQFTDTVSYAGSTGITIGGQFVQVNSGDIVRIVVWSSGTGSIYMGSQISTMQLQNASVYINNMQTPVRTGQITAISIHGYSNPVSTLTLTIPSQNAQTYLKVGTVDIIPNNGGSDSRTLNLYNITTTNGSNGVLNMKYGSTIEISSGYVGTCEIIT
jgi:PKD repeat protein